MTIRAAVLERPNALTLVRLVLASLVIVSHGWPLGGFGDLWGGEPPWGRWAVAGFFCLSGFLITRSRLQLPFGRFLWHRVLRIFPGAWVCLLVVAFVLAPLSLLNGGEWRPRVVAGYLVRNVDLSSMALRLPDTIGGQAWLGSMWTLEYELAAYVMAGVLLTGLVARRPLAPVVALLVLSTVWAQLWPVADAPWLLAMFAAGMLMYLVSDRLPLHPGIAAASVGVLVAIEVLEMPFVWWALPLSYLMLWLGASVPARWSPRDDISYGIYVYGFAVQVLVEWFLPDLSLVAHIVVSLALTAPLAYASWVFVERPALRLKHLTWRQAGQVARHPSRLSSAARRGTPSSPRRAR